MKHILLNIAIMLLAAGLRFARIEQQSFWNDEGNSARIAERSAAKIVAGAAADIHPPGYYLGLARWRGLVGQSEFSLRAFSAFAGILTVAGVIRLGTVWFGPLAGFFAGGLAALNPFLIYYSQEARMYAPAALFGAATFYFAARWLARGKLFSAAGFVVVAAAGLYTHYSFPFVLAAANAWMLLKLIPRRSRALLTWLALQVGVLVLYLPWLPTAWRQLVTWPAAREFLPIPVAFAAIGRWLVYGPTAETGSVAPGVVAFAMLALAGLLQRRALAAALWLLAPVFMTLALGLFSAVFAKFLLVAAPAACLLAGNGIAIGVGGIRRASAAQDRAGVWLLAGALVALSAGWLRFDLVALRNLYTNPAYFRADYRAIAQQIESGAQRGDAVLLNAPNQWEVFTYYFHDTDRVYPLARTRPLDVAVQRTELEAIAAARERLFVLYWGDAQSDPNRVIESWLNTNTFKAFDEWYGDVRLSTYAAPRAATAAPVPLAATFGDAIALDGYSLAATNAAAGDILQLTLYWRARAPIEERYKVFVHLVDDPNRAPVAQRDSEPGGGLALTTTWTPGETNTDRHGVLLPRDLAPGTYQLLVGLYRAADGERLAITSDGQGVGDRLFLERIEVVPYQ